MSMLALHTMFHKTHEFAKNNLYTQMFHHFTLKWGMTAECSRLFCYTNQQTTPTRQYICNPVKMIMGSAKTQEDTSQNIFCKTNNGSVSAPSNIVSKNYSLTLNRCIRNNSKLNF